MRSDAKASSAGSTQGRGSRSGSFVRGAGATRARLLGADGSGAPSHRGRIAALSLTTALLSLALFASSAFAAKELLSYFGTFAGSGSFGGELNNPRDVAVNGTGVGPANPGDAYVADEANNRIERFDSKGNFVSAWGKDVIAPVVNERQRIVLNEATGGTFTVAFDGSTTAPIQPGPGPSGFQEILATLPTIGSGNVEVSGFGTPTNPFIVTFKGALSGANQPTLTADASELNGTISISTIANGTSTTADTGTGFEICTVAKECQAGVASGGDGTAAGNGSLAAPQSVAVDLDTGNLYVSDRDNRRIDEYDGAGNFIRSFGWDVAESGPGDTGTEYEVCIQAEGDVCKAGVGGSGVGQYGEGFAENGFGIAVSPADGNASTGTVYLADSGNQRVATFNLDGTSPASFGSSAQFGEGQPRSIAVDSRGIVYASDSNNNGDVLRYDSLNANGGGVGFLAPIVPPNNERQGITFTGFNTGDNFRLTCPDGSPTGELTYAGESIFGESVGAPIIRKGLEEACGAGNFSVSGFPPNFTVTFQGAFAGANQPQMTCTTLSGSGSCSVSTTSEGHPGPLLTGSASSATVGLAVNPAGTVLYVLRVPSSPPPVVKPTVVQQFGPINEPGLTAAPTVSDDTHGAAAAFPAVRGFGFDSASGRFYVSVNNDPDFFEGPLPSGHRVYVFADSSALPSPTASMSFPGVTAIADRSATFHGSVNPNGGLASCKFQYSTDEVHWTEAGSAEGTGDVSGKTITNVKATIGAFVVGQLINGARIEAIKGNTLTLSFTALQSGTNVSFRATPEFPPRCELLNLNSGSQDISQKVTGLIPGQKYFARLQVTRPYFSSFTPVTTSFTSFTTAAGAPVLADVSAKAVDERSVRVSATIDPGNSPTSYVVQYGTTPTLGSSTGPVQIGAGTSPVEVSPVISGLSPGTQYYFKLIATNLVGSMASKGLAIATFPSPPSFGPCANDLLRTGPSAKLPDCRAYEQVTPTNKFGSDAYGTPYSVQASNSGDGITFYTFANFPGAEGFQEANTLHSRFAGGQWSTAGLNLPPSYGDEVNVLAWTSDLRLSFTTTRFAGFTQQLVMRDSADDSRIVLIPPGMGFFSGAFKLGGAFDNRSKVVFTSIGAIPVTSGPAAVSSERNVYLYDRETGELTLAGLLPDSACGSPPCVPVSGSELPATFEGYFRDGNTVSSSGNIYFADAGTGQLYLRREAAGSGASTVQVSASERTNPDPAGTFAPAFMGATPDGSHAFFKSRQKLTDNSTATAGAEDLYRFDANAPTGERLTDLAPGAKAVGMVGYSDSGDYVYFASNGDLDGAGPAAAGNCAGQTFDNDSSNFSGVCSLYLWQADGAGACATAGGCVVFIARTEAKGFPSDGYNWAGSTGYESGSMKASRVSADGRILVFRSKQQLTAYDNTPPDGACQKGPGNEPFPCAQFYRYDAESGQITCLTCDPTGAPPTGTPDLKNPDMFHANTAHSAYSAQPFLSRNLSPDGNRFFFQTPQKLVPADVNGDVSCQMGPGNVDPATGAGPPCRDVYMWEAPGTGSCATNSGAFSPANGGCIYLLSTGTGPYPSYIADISESGDTAFIFSRQQLVPSDEDAQEDIYAVKVNGGLAYQHATRPAACEGDACRGAASKPSNAPGAGTAVFEGPGNPKSGTNTTRCPKGKRQVRSKGKVRCVAKQRGSKKHKQKRDRKRAANNNRRASR